MPVPESIAMTSPLPLNSKLQMLLLIAFARVESFSINTTLEALRSELQAQHCRFRQINQVNTSLYIYEEY